MTELRKPKAPMWLLFLMNAISITTIVVLIATLFLWLNSLFV